MANKKREIDKTKASLTRWLVQFWRKGFAALCGLVFTARACLDIYFFFGFQTYLASLEVGSFLFLRGLVYSIVSAPLLALQLLEFCFSTTALLWEISCSANRLENEQEHKRTLSSMFTKEQRKSLPAVEIGIFCCREPVDMLAETVGCALNVDYDSEICVIVCDDGNDPEARQRLLADYQPCAVPAFPSGFVPFNDPDHVLAGGFAMCVGLEPPRWLVYASRLVSPGAKRKGKAGNQQFLWDLQPPHRSHRADLLVNLDLDFRMVRSSLEHILPIMFEKKVSSSSPSPSSSFSLLSPSPPPLLRSEWVITSKIGALQARQLFDNSNSGKPGVFSANSSALHFGNRFLNRMKAGLERFHGTNVIFNRPLIEERFSSQPQSRHRINKVFGSSSVVEDQVHSLRFETLGLPIRYTTYPGFFGQAPPDLLALQVQRKRWTEGKVVLLFKLLLGGWRKYSPRAVLLYLMHGAGSALSSSIVFLCLLCSVGLRTGFFPGNPFFFPTLILPTSTLLLTVAFMTVICPQHQLAIGYADSCFNTFFVTFFTSRLFAFFLTRTRRLISSSLLRLVPLSPSSSITPSPFSSACEFEVTPKRATVSQGNRREKTKPGIESISGFLSVNVIFLICFIVAAGYAVARANIELCLMACHMIALLWPYTWWTLRIVLGRISADEPFPKTDPWFLTVTKYLSWFAHYAALIYAFQSGLPYSLTTFFFPSV